MLFKYTFILCSKGCVSFTPTAKPSLKSMLSRLTDDSAGDLSLVIAARYGADKCGAIARACGLTPVGAGMPPKPTSPKARVPPVSFCYSPVTPHAQMNPFRDRSETEDSDSTA
eukprot:g12931.t1